MAKVKEPIATKIPRRFSYGQVAGYVRVSTFEQDETPERGIRVQFVKENLTLTGADSPMSNLLLSVMGAFAEFERAHIRERQRGNRAGQEGRGISGQEEDAVAAAGDGAAPATGQRRGQSGTGARVRYRSDDSLSQCKEKKVICHNEEVNPGGDRTEP
jgi:hypothetical protein